MPSIKALSSRWGFAVSTLFLFNSLTSAAEDNHTFPGEDPSLWGESEKIYSATKYITRLKEAPAIATVITAREIENMGARDLVEVLKHVPGIGVSIGTSFGKYNIESRGIRVNHSTNTLLLIDGHSLNDVYYGSGLMNFFEMPVTNVKRIEVVRSPGSALYGTSAFGAVINVMTKDNAGYDETELQAGYGTYARTQGTLLDNHSIGKLKLHTYLNYMSADSRDLYVASDNTGRSGYTLDDFSRLDANIKLQYQDLNALIGYLNREEGPYIGVAHALNTGTRQRGEIFFSDVKYRWWRSEALQFNFRGYLDYQYHRTDWELRPAEVNPFFSGSLAGRPHASARVKGAEAQMDYTPSDTDLFTLGVSYEKREIASASRHSNFNPLTYAPLGSMQDVSSWANFTRLGAQYISALYFQNIWRMYPDLTVTVGARYDEYINQFGGTFNPRAVVVWNQSDKTTFKLLYGTAFRAPNLLELYIDNNIVVTGNENLKPEKNTSYEFSVNHEWNSIYSAEVNLFYTNIKDLITQSTAALGATYTNRGGLDTKGAELEVKANMNTSDYAYANYTFQDPRDEMTGKLHYGISRHKANAGINIGLTPRIFFNSNVSAVGQRSRSTTDKRPPLGGYGVVDVSLTFKDYLPKTQMQFTIYNLFDKTYYDPDETDAVPSDYPREGQTVMLTAKYTI